MKLSKCCNLPLGAITMTCPGCGKAHDMHGNLYPTTPTSTQLEEILEDLGENYYPWHEYSGIHEDRNIKAIKEATQAITRLIQQAELRGRIDQMKAVRSQLSNAHHLSKDVDTLGYLHDTYQSMELALQSQLAKGGSDEN